MLRRKWDFLKFRFRRGFPRFLIKHGGNVLRRGVAQNEKVLLFLERPALKKQMMDCFFVSVRYHSFFLTKMPFPIKTVTIGHGFAVIEVVESVLHDLPE